MDYDADTGGVDRGRSPNTHQYIQSDAIYGPDAEPGEIEKISRAAGKAGVITAWVVAVVSLVIFVCCAGGLLLNYAFGH